MNLSMFRTGLIAGILVILPFPALTSAESGSAPVELDTVVVTAQKETDDFQTGDVDRDLTPAFHTVIERESFEGRMEGLSDVIEKEAGIQIRQSGGLGSFSSVSLRGSASEQVMVYMDGVLINEASGGGVDLSGIALSNVESVEIFRGISPINFNKASMGGVVNIRTLRSKASKEKITAKATAEYGSFDTWKLSGFVNHKPGDWDYLVSADYKESENDFEILNDNGTKYNSADDRREDRNNEQFDQAGLLGKIGYDLTDTARISFSNQWFSRRQGIPSWNNSGRTATSLDTRRNASTLEFIADDIGPGRFNTITRFEYTDSREVYDDREGHIGLGKQHIEYVTRKAGGDFFLEWLTDRNVLSFILAGGQETYQPKDFLNRKSPHDSERKQFSAGLQDSLTMLDGRLILTPALRYTLIRDELESAVSSFGEPLPGRDRSEDYVNPQFGLKYRPARLLTLKANAARYTREPSFYELFGDRGIFMGNEDLEAEKGVNADAGFEIRKTFDDRLVQSFSINAAFFISEVDDLITRRYDSHGIGKSMNISKSSILGIESGLTLTFLDYFRLTVNYTRQDTENKGRDPLFDGKQLPGRFESAVYAKLEARHRGVKIYGEYIGESGMYYDPANLLKAEDREQFNAGFSVLYDRFLFNTEVQNIGDDNYEAFNGYPRPGISYFASLSYTY